HGYLRADGGERRAVNDAGGCLRRHRSAKRNDRSASMTFTTVVTADELHERLGHPEVAIFDCRHALDDFALGRRLYDESHIPGAYFADLEADATGPKTGTNGRHPLPDPERFARFLRVRGVNDDTQIVAYDEGGDIFAPRFWFLARWIGHDAV